MTTFEQIYQGLTIFRKYKNPEIEPAHDEVYAGAEEPISEEDVIKLKELGWIDDGDYWSIFT